jgi:drug/metabolite transporter (DMT)-like permease
MVKNFWGGLTTVILGGVGLWHFPVERYPLNLTVVSLLIGMIVIFMWIFNLLAYKGGAYISLKKLVMNGSYLIMATMTGALFFGEAITIAKVVGIILFSAAFILMDKGTWEALSGCHNKQKKDL